MRDCIPVSAAVLAALASTACGGGTTVQVPPELDLTQYQRVALVMFTVENAKGSLHELATERFAEQMLDAQRIEVLELGDQSWLLAETGQRRYGPAEARAVGKEQGVSAVFFGHMIVSEVKPTASLSDLARVGAEVDVSLSVRMLSTESGATLWGSSSEATGKVAEMVFDGGIPDFGARDPSEAYGELVDVLVHDVTRDMRPTWVRQ
jgi:hypothetical protein